MVTRAYCNLRVYREKDGRRTLVRRAHNLVLTNGLNQLRSAVLGTAWQLSAIGVGRSGTAVAASQTWGLDPLLVAAPTDSYSDGPVYRATLRIGEDELVGKTIREVWLAPTTDAPPTGPGAYCRAVIQDLAKTAEYAYVFIFEASWGGGCSRLAWSMLAAQANSNGAYSYELSGIVCGRGTSPPTVGDTGLVDPWTMTALPIASVDESTDGQLTVYATIPPDQYNGSTLAEVGLLYAIASGAPPVAAGMLGRALIEPAYPIEVGKGAQIVIIVRWESA